MGVGGRTMRSTVMILIALVAMALPASPQASFPPDRPVVQQKRHGAVRLTLTTDRASLGLAERLRLTLSAEAPSGTELTMPPQTERLGAFTVLRQTASEPATVAPHVQQWRQEYLLEATASGPQTIPPLTVAFRLPDATQEPPPTQIRTDPLAITVTTVLPDQADLTAPKDITPPVALLRPGPPLWVWAGIAVLAILGLAGSIWWWFRQQRRQTTRPPRPAHILALEALRRLRLQDLTTQQRIEEFYMRLSAIVRRYIETRFGLGAPEQTTEEFLAALLTTGGLIAAHRELLSAFLHQCDLVKFARHQPTVDDMQQALASAVAFVEQTADAHVLVEGAVSGDETP